MQNGFSSSHFPYFDGDKEKEKTDGLSSSFHKGEESDSFSPSKESQFSKDNAYLPKDEAERLFQHIHQRAMEYLSSSSSTESASRDVEDLPDFSPEGQEIAQEVTREIEKHRYVLLRSLRAHDIPAFAHHAGITADVLVHLLASPGLGAQDLISILQSPNVQEDILMRVLTHPGATEVVYDLVLTHVKSRDVLLSPFLHLRLGDPVFFRVLLKTEFFTEEFFVRTVAEQWKFTHPEMVQQFFARSIPTSATLFTLLGNASLQEEDLMYLIGCPFVTQEHLQCIIAHPSFTYTLVSQYIASPLFQDVHLFGLFTWVQKEGIGLSCTDLREILLHSGISPLGLSVIIGSDDFSFALLPDILHHPLCTIEHVKALYVRAQRESRTDTLAGLRDYILTQGFADQDTYLSLMTGIFYRG